MTNKDAFTILKTTEKETITKTIVHETDKGFSIKETLINGVYSGIDINCSDKDLTPIFLDLPSNWVEEYKEYADLFKWKIEPKCLDDIDISKLYFAYTYGNMLFDANKNIVSIPHIFNYIGSITEKVRNDSTYCELMKLLHEHPYFLELKESEVPYYNADFGGQKGIAHAKVYLPQDKYEELYNRFKGNEYWSCNIRDAITVSYNKIGGIYGDDIDKLVAKLHDTEIQGDEEIDW